MMIGRRGALGLVMAAMPGAARAAYPDRPVRLVVPFTPGGSVDLMARAFGRALGEQLGQAIVVENRPGATTSIGSAYVARAEADGYTLLSGGTNVGLNKVLIRNLPYDPDRDLVAVSLLTVVPYLLVLNPDLPARTLPELVAYARANPGKLTYASFGVGGAGHIAGEMFNGMTGAEMVHIPYNGTAPGLSDVMGGRVSLSFCTIPPALPLIQAGRLRAIALTGQDHLPALPGIPTMHEAGLPGFECTSLNLIFAPAATPREVVARVNEASNNALRDQRLRDMLVAEGFVVAPPLSPEQTAEQFRASVARLLAVVDRAGIRIN